MKCMICGIETEDREICEECLNRKVKEAKRSYKSGKIAPPSAWMYILSFFLPVLQWILMGVYVMRDEPKKAFQLWLYPFLVRALIVIAVFLLYIMAAVDLINETM